MSIRDDSKKDNDGASLPSAKNPILDEALRLARLGYRVFPCRKGTEQPATVNGVQDATRKPRVIRRWFEANPQLNLAISTDRLVVVCERNCEPADDLDLADDLEKASAIGGVPGGTCYFFRRPAGVSWTNSIGKPIPGFEVHTNGSFVAVWPSVLAGPAVDETGYGFEWFRPLIGRPETLVSVPIDAWERFVSKRGLAATLDVVAEFNVNLFDPAESRHLGETLSLPESIFDQRGF